MQIIGRFQYFALGAVVAFLILAFFPLIIHEDHSKVFIYTKKIPAQDITIDSVKKEISIKGQKIELRDGKFSGTARVGVASNTMIVDNIKIQNNQSLFDSIINNLPSFLAGVLVGRSF